MYLKKLIIWIIPLIFVGCVSIPPEAPELSQELGKKISAIENANIKLLNKFFDQKRKEVDNFVNEEWTPLFAEKIFTNKKVATIWDKIVSENNKQDRLMFLIKMGPKLQLQINKKRQELIAPIDELERAIEKQLRSEYSQAKAINNSISSLLLSSSEVSENRNRYLNMIGLTNEKMEKTIDKTDYLISSLLKKTSGSIEKVEKANEYIKKMKSLRDSI